MDKFEEDIRAMQKLLELRYGFNNRNKIAAVGAKLIELHKKNHVKINHSIMEYVLAAYLISRGFEVDVEHPLERDLVADLIAWKDGESLIIEVETGFTSPENALDPQSYLTARIVSKIARYSPHADKFGLATPAHNILQIPDMLLKPSRRRSRKNLLLLKELCDRYYATPRIALEKLSKMRLHAVYVINVDTLEVRKLTPRKYLEKFRNLYPSRDQIKKYVRAGLRRREAYEHAAT